MSRKRRDRSSSLGFSTHLGWSACTATLILRGEITSVQTFRLTTAEPDDRLAIEPYHVAGGFDGLNRVPPPANPESCVEQGLTRQRRAALQALRDVLLQLDDWPMPRSAGLLTGRGRQAADLTRVLSSHTQIHVAEGNAVRDSMTRACAASGIEVMPIDRKSLSETISTLRLDESAVWKVLDQLRPDNDGPWRKEEKVCAVTALIAIQPT